MSFEPRGMRNESFVHNDSHQRKKHERNKKNSVSNKSDELKYNVKRKKKVPGQKQNSKYSLFKELIRELQIKKIQKNRICLLAV
jgi:hypothetical protein